MLHREPPEPGPIQAGEEVQACPICGTEQPGISVRLLRSVVKRKGRRVSVIDGETIRCLKCNGEWSYGYRTGIFDKHRVYAEPAKQSQEDEPLPPPPVKFLKPRERKSSV